MGQTLQPCRDQTGKQKNGRGFLGIKYGAAIINKTPLPSLHCIGGKGH